jgi:hypothetical protein
MMMQGDSGVGGLDLGKSSTISLFLLFLPKAFSFENEISLTSFL